LKKNSKRTKIIFKDMDRMCFKRNFFRGKISNKFFVPRLVTKCIWKESFFRRKNSNIRFPPVSWPNGFEERIRKNFCPPCVFRKKLFSKKEFEQSFHPLFRDLRISKEAFSNKLFSKKEFEQTFCPPFRDTRGRKKVWTYLKGL
jgi:hypothetical protein